MTNSIKIFENERFGKIRTTTDEHGNPWFVGKDVAEVLGYSNSRKAVSDHVKNKNKRDGVTFRDSMGRKQNPIIINESGLYSLILSSRLPAAEDFQDWVTSEVLPSIRKTGSYSISRPSYEIEDTIERAKAWIKEEEERRKLELENKVMQPKAEYYDVLVDKGGNTNIRDTAKELGIKQNDFVKYLLEHDYLYRDKRGKLLPTSKSTVNGLMELKEWHNNKFTGNQTFITPKGKQKFIKVMR